MPLKNHRTHSQKKQPKHYAKVYWPYIPLLLVVGLSLFVGQSFVSRSQRGVLSYATDISQSSLLQETNQKRQQAKVSSLELDKKLNTAAQAKADDMVARDYWSHNTPEKKAPWAFIESANYDYQKAGENLAFGFMSSSETVNGWMNSESHRLNLTDTAYTEVGFGIAQAEDYLGNGPETVIVAMYARPASAAPVSTAPTTLHAGANLPVNTSQRLSTEPAVQSVSKLQSVTGDSLPGISFIIGLLSGIALAYLVIKHSVGLKRFIRNGERFVLKHPVLDVTLASFIALSALLSQGVGYIR
jgi:hypothetical protein